MSSHIRIIGVVAMRVSNARILDDKYMEFIEVLQSLGELQNIKRLLADLSDAYIRMDGVGRNLREIESGAAIHTLWENGWIEVCEVNRQSKGTPRRKYTLRINLEKISCYFRQERIHGAVLSGGLEAQALS
jgi:predicted transcriptional regulator